MSSPEREERLRRAERARQAGRLDLATAELEELVAMFPDDVGLANMLGDLHVSQGQPAHALPLFLRVGDHFFREGFYSKATGVYRKILKFVPRDESMVLRLAEALAAQGLSVEARAQFTVVETARRHRGDKRGAEDVSLRMSDLEPTDLAARWAAARALAQRGDAAAIGRYEDLASEFERQHRFDEALAVWHEVVSLTPADAGRRERAARWAWARGDAVSARIFLGIDDMPAHGPALALLTEIEMRTGSVDGVRAAAGRWLDLDRNAQSAIVDLAVQEGASAPDRAWACVSVPVARALASGRFTEAEHALRTFVSTGILHGPGLVQWVEVAVLAHLDGVVDLVRERLRSLPGHADGPVSARAVIDAASRRVVPHGAWIALFDECLGRRPATLPHGATVVALPRTADAVLSAAVVAGTESPETAGSSVDEVPMPPAGVVAEPDVVAPEQEFIEIDLTDALNAIVVRDVAEHAGAPDATGPDAHLSLVASADAREEPAVGQVSEVEARACLAQGQAFLAAGMPDEARVALTRALGAPHTAPQAALALADLHEEGGAPGEACRVLEHVLPSAVGRDRGQVLAQLVVSLEHLGNAAQALRRLGELAEVLPHHPIVRARRGREEPSGR